MKAAIVRGAGQTPVYGEFSKPVPSEGESRIAVTATAISPLVKSRAAGTHYSPSGQFPFVVGIAWLPHLLLHRSALPRSDAFR